MIWRASMLTDEDRMRGEEREREIELLGREGAE